MNDSNEKLLAQLEQATASATSEMLDEETAMLRESWLAFGKLVDAADAESTPSITCPPTTRRAGLFARSIAALAASLLVAFTAWSILNRDSDPVVPAPEVAVPQALPSEGPGLSTVAESPSSGEQPEPVDEFAWDDSFDEQLAITSQAIRSARADWSGGDRRYSVLLDQFEQFDEELSEGSL
ncbi:MAG: hypothetical protein H6821_16560 [Planctomycetaceae bacterium]|nr:hypothetical protein [Planctomycetales bacterium]MCB9875784.1 hypothetical protein [Planctomycetaceae bacterium]MCB9938216.1 hypothetical protein [Planctomycetaceae bacterium]